MRQRIFFSFVLFLSIIFSLTTNMVYGQVKKKSPSTNTTPTNIKKEVKDDHDDKNDDDDDGVGNVPGGPPHSQVPFDGGITLLLGAGLAYGVKKAIDKRKK